MVIINTYLLDNWHPSGDYGTEFKNELKRMQKLVNNMIEDLEQYRKSINNNSKNCKITEETIEEVDKMIRKLQHSNDSLQISISTIRYYNGGR